MGHLRRQAVLVTADYDVNVSWKDAPPEWDGLHWIEAAHRKAKEICTVCPVTEIVDSDVNGDRHFMVAPDGSKEGWATSKEGDKERAEFIAWLRSCAYNDGSSPLAWVEVQYGDDDDIAKVCSSGDDDSRLRQEQLYPSARA